MLLSNCTTSPASPAGKESRCLCVSGAAYVRYWLGAGRGGFGLSPSECISPSFYVVAYQSSEDPLRHLRGWRIKSSKVPVKDPYFATLKSNNYLANALVAMDAEASGYDQVLAQHSARPFASTTENAVFCSSVLCSRPGRVQTAVPSAAAGCGRAYSWMRQAMLLRARL